VDIDDLHNEVIRAFNFACATRSAPGRVGRGFRPLADAFFEEESRQIVVRFELPGVPREQIDLLVERRELVVRGERRFQSAEGRVYQQVEMDYGPFERRLRLNVDVDPQATSATYENGILEVRLTLVARSAEPHKITIQTEDKP
jgi:HSP20 family protein